MRDIHGRNIFIPTPAQDSDKKSFNANEMIYNEVYTIHGRNIFACFHTHSCSTITRHCPKEKYKNKNANSTWKTSTIKITKKLLDNSSSFAI